jgi:hypothetical protein
MNPMDGPLAGATVFACLFSSALAGVAVHARLPGRLQHQSGGGIVRGGVAVVAGIVGIILVLMTLGQKAAFDTADRDVQKLAAQLITLDHGLRAAGPAGAPARESLFRYTVNTIQTLWPDSNRLSHTPIADAAAALHQLDLDIAELAKGSPEMRGIAAGARRALNDAVTLDHAVQARANGRVSPYLTGLALLALMLAFAALGLWAPLRPARTLGGAAPSATHPLTLASLFVGALVLGGAMFLLSEYNNPFSGVIIVSYEPLQNALFAISE